ncbi:hypothetical protein PHYSODRAFT_514381 [Phytophthora sojae]|uniref:Uncharacterized protein n=1 Tax=Phytophthora sojae (strain P6497) TaxID=1094619 RepID=G4ZQU7_PHYSP|nr:hypothetical protein PHYSODRAFT_514381 [Phytophthora sojae]EGZ13895.1 hypothetical protein PHYSODRAFT_514381 [Phytophthora sojae]|eukprot:XP_009531324.1 hypothetical protein PHYSODRAFT_514381 [Phytophthora sojae]
MLSVVFPYQQVVLCFLLPGHSHNIADRVIAWCRRAVHKQNVYTPAGLVEEVNKVKRWGDLLAKYFTAPPAGYTANYLFEIDEGVCTARKTVNTPDDESITFSMISQSNLANIRKAVIAELFGPNVRSIWEASIASVQLPRHQTMELSEKKQKSLAAKYFSIPKKYLDYYPAVPEAILNAPESADEDADHSTTERATAKCRPGRPKKKKTKLKANQPSILQFFSAKPKQTSS